MPSTKQRILSHIAQLASPEPTNTHQTNDPTYLSPYPQYNPPTPYSLPANSYGGNPQQRTPSPYLPSGGYPQQSGSSPYSSPYGGHSPQGVSTPNASSMYQNQSPQRSRPMSLLFHLQKQYNTSGNITDEGGNTLYVVTAEAENHSLKGSLTFMPLYITRKNGAKVGNIHFKLDYLKSEVEPFTVWGDEKGRITLGSKQGKSGKVKFLGDIADKKGIFSIPEPSGPREFSWESKDKGESYLLLDRQFGILPGAGLDSKGGYAAVAIYTCHTKVKKGSKEPSAKLMIMPEVVNSVPGILDACIMWCFFCEAMKQAGVGVNLGEILVSEITSAAVAAAI